MRLLWSSTTVSSTVWSGLPLMWLIFQQSIAVEGILLLYKGNFALVQQLPLYNSEMPSKGSRGYGESDAALPFCPVWLILSTHNTAQLLAKSGGADG